MLKEGKVTMMKKLSLIALVMLLLAGIAVAQTSAPQYKQVNKFTIGGEGGWDYITYDQSSNRLFIGHNSQILVVDAASGKKLGEVPANRAHGAAIVPDKGLGFSSNGGAGTVTVFDLKTLAPKGDIKVGENPDAIIYDPYSKKVVVMNGRSKDLMAIDPDTQKVVATVPLGGKLEFAAADSGHVYVNVEDTGEIAVVDSKTWKATQRWKLEGCEEPSGLAIDEKTDHLFSVCGNKKMIVVDAKTGKMLATLPTGDGTDGAAFDTGMKVAFASNGEGTLTVVGQGKGGNYEVLANVPTERGARTVAVDSKTHRVYLPTAEFGPPAEGQKRPSIKPGTFMVLVYEPVK
jgi:YVTN family beta-propeller protein